eukprot:5617003-Amphidinium_carterae.1
MEIIDVGEPTAHTIMIGPSPQQDTHSAYLPFKRANSYVLASASIGPNPLPASFQSWLLQPSFSQQQATTDSSPSCNHVLPVWANTVSHNCGAPHPAEWELRDAEVSMSGRSLTCCNGRVLRAIEVASTYDREK